MNGSKLILLAGGFSLALIAGCSNGGKTGTTGTGTGTSTGGSTSSGSSSSGGSSSGGSTTGGSTSGGSSSGGSTSGGSSTGGTDAGCTPTSCPSGKHCSPAGVCVDCLKDSDCTPSTLVCAGFFCRACEPAALANAPGGILAVDGTAGVDTACCGIPNVAAGPPGMAGPCKTIATIMSNYVSGILDGGTDADGGLMTAGDTIEVTGATAAGDWTADTTYPIWLGAGVILHAPGIYFSGSGPNTNPISAYLDGGFTGLSQVPTTTFYVAPLYDADDAGVRLEGATGNPVIIGVNSNGVIAGGTSPNTAVQVERPDQNAQETLTIQNANVIGGPPGSAADASAYTYGIGLEVGPGGALNIGPAPVQVGNFTVKATPVAGGGIGVHCNGEPLGATVGDNTPDAGTTLTLLTVQGQSYDIWIDVSCQATLSGNPVFGVAPVAQVCAEPKVDGTGALVINNGVLNLANGTIHCMDVDGLDIEVAACLLRNTTITHCGCAATFINGGNLTSTNTGNDRNIFARSHFGVWSDSPLTTGAPVMINFSGPGGGVPSGNQATCASPNEPGQCHGSVIPAIDVLNSVERPAPPPHILMDNSYWERAIPPIFVCDGGVASTNGLAPCTCSGGQGCVGFIDGNAPPDNSAIVQTPNESASAFTVAGGIRANQPCPP
jgi:hypothetical protein